MKSKRIVQENHNFSPKQFFINLINKILKFHNTSNYLEKPNLSIPAYENKCFQPILVSQTQKQEEKEKASKYLSEIILKFSDFEFCSHAFNVFARVSVERGELPENGLGVTELLTLAELSSKAENGMLKRNDFNELMLIKSGECFEKISKKLLEKNSEVVEAKQEYFAKQFPLLNKHYAAKRAERLERADTSNQPICSFSK